MILFGSRSASRIPGDKESSNWIIWVSTPCLHAAGRVPSDAATPTESDKNQTEGGVQDTELLNTST